MPDENFTLPAAPNYGLSDKQKKMDYPGGSWVRRCWKCKGFYFDHPRDGNQCNHCTELLESISDGQ